MIVVLLLGLYRADLSPRGFDDAAQTTAGVILIAVPLGFWVWIRHFEETLGHGGDLVLLSMVSIWGCDGGAYYTGRAFGRHKLAPRVSPKKTWEGFAGGVAGAVAGAFLYRAIAWGDELSAPMVLGVGLLIGVLGPPGDLAESALKRSAGVKDSGRLFPGHGGLLDRVDSLLLTGPVLYYYYRLALSG